MPATPNPDSRREAFTLIELPTVRKGFTLIELLVVVAIIAMLISILLPSLSKAREAAKRVYCGSNVRQLVLGYSVYSADSRGVIPSTYHYGNRWSHYLLYDTSRYMGPGLLYKQKVVTSPDSFYCPSEQIDPRLMFNTSINTWPPGPASDGGDGDYDRTAYGTRPVVPVNSSDWPNLNEMNTTTALIADYVFGPSTVDGRHQEGVNAGKADGSVSFVSKSHIQDILDVLPTGPLAGISAAFNPYYLDDSGPTPTGLWALYDRW